MKGLFFFESLGVPGGSPELGKGNSGWVPSPLHYITSTRILARMGLHFHTNFTHLPRAFQVFGAVAGEKFRVDIDNSQLDITLDFFSLFTWLFCLHKCL